MDRIGDLGWKVGVMLIEMGGGFHARQLYSFFFQTCFPLVHYNCFIRLNQLQLLLYIRQHVCLKVDGNSFVHVLYHRDWRWMDNDTLC